MVTYRELFYMRFSNPRGNIRKGTKTLDVWNSIEEFLRLVLTPPEKTKKVKKAKDAKIL